MEKLKKKTLFQLMRILMNTDNHRAIHVPELNQFRFSHNFFLF